MTFEEWVATVPQTFKNDALWRIEAYRLALFLSDLVGRDADTLVQNPRTLKSASQLFRAVGSIGANIAEGFSRRSTRDQARLYEYALGSAREARHWYYQSRIALSPEILNHRMRILTMIIRLLLTMIPDRRDRGVHEEVIPYGVKDTDIDPV